MSEDFTIFTQVPDLLLTDFIFKKKSVNKLISGKDKLLKELSILQRESDRLYSIHRRQEKKLPKGKKIFLFLLVFMI